MFTVDIPYVPLVDAQMVLASQNGSTGVTQNSVPQAKVEPSLESRELRFEHCKDVNGFPNSAYNDLPILHGVVNSLGYSWKTIESGKVPSSVFASIKTTLVEGPKHGKVEYTEPLGYFWHYTPESGYIGADRAVFLVEARGKRFRYTWNLLVYDVISEFDKTPACEIYFRKKVGTLDMIDGNSAYEQAWGSLFRSAFSSLSFSFTDLPGTAVGQTTGEGKDATITLDTNAAGHNWFIDTTPTDNSEFLPTSDSNVWKAKAGSAAEGKMDMLSVLLHEYGHALGFEHSSNSADFMSASLVAGERRLPNTEELTLMAQLVAQLKGDADSPTPTTPHSPFDPSAPLGGSLGLLALGRLRRNDYGNWSIALDSAQLWAPTAPQPQPQYEAAVNATLTNGNLNNTAGWRSSGNIALNGTTGAGVTLGESNSADAHLSQGFMINSGDRYLSFTGAALGPTDGLTHSDALLNIQLDSNGSTGPAQLRTLRGQSHNVSCSYQFDMQFEYLRLI